MSFRVKLLLSRLKGKFVKKPEKLAKEIRQTLEEILDASEQINSPEEVLIIRRALANLKAINNKIHELVKRIEQAK